MTHPSKVRFSGPLKPFAAGFASELSLQGYTRDSAGHQVRLMAQVSRWLAEQSLEADALCPKNVERFLENRRASGYTTHRTERGMRPMLAYLRRLGVVHAPPVVAPEGPVEELLAHYWSYLTVERGLGHPTTRGYIDSIRPFLLGRVSSKGGHIELDDLSALDVREFVVARCPGQSRSQAKLTVTVLRSFLGFLHCEGIITRSLAAAVPSVAGWRLAGIPKGLEPRELRSLLASCDRRTTSGRRDFAILTVLARLGLRSGEVSALSLDDIDWRAGTLVVRGKGSRLESLPLPADVGEAVTAYLRNSTRFFKYTMSI